MTTRGGALRGQGLDSPVEEEHKAEEGHDEAGGDETQACAYKRVFRVLGLGFRVL